MLKRIFLIISILALASCQRQAIRDAIGAQLREYPETRVQDVYKDFCQDNLGPGHLIPNPASAQDYLLSELREYREDLDSARYLKPELRYFPVGDRHNFVRVDLSVVLDGLVGEEALLDAFVRSANEGRISSEKDWVRKWRRVAAVLKRDFPGIPGATADLAAIDSLIAGGNLILHHSPDFEEAYHPHYRIVASDIFDEELKDLIK
jgi:hypothetical protein